MVDEFIRNGNKIWLWALSALIGALFTVCMIMAGYLWSNLNEHVSQIATQVSAMQAQLSDLKATNQLLNQRLTDSLEERRKK